MGTRVGGWAGMRVCGRRQIQPQGAGLKFEDIIDEVAGVYPKIMLEGAMDAGAWSCGMVAGLIHDIPTCKALIDRIMAEADAIVRQRLMGFVAG